MASLPPGLFKHPRTGMYWIKRRVPADLVSTLGRRTVQETLGTKDLRQAEGMYLERMGKIVRAWAALAADRSPMSRRTVAGLAGEFYRSVLSKHEADAGEAEQWEKELARLQEMRRPRGRRPNNPHGSLQHEVYEFLLARGYDYTHSDIRSIVVAFAEARDMAYRHLARMAKGDYSPDPEAARFPALVAQPSATAMPITARRNSLTVADHWDAYVAGTGIALGTQKRFRPILVALGRHLGTTNLADATPAAIVAWTKSLAASGLSAKTIGEGYLAATRAFFSWAMKEKLVHENPCKGITVKGPKQDKLEPARSKGFTPEEATLILSETLRDPNLRAPANWVAARRWIPWICAYNVARREKKSLAAAACPEDRRQRRLTRPRRPSPPVMTGASCHVVS